MVLVDNGRVDTLADPKMREALFCIRCGACLNVCPVYRKIGGHAYGWVYSGPIGALITPQFTSIGQARELPVRFFPLRSLLRCLSRQDQYPRSPALFAQ